MYVLIHYGLVCFTKIVIAERFQHRGTIARPNRVAVTLSQKVWSLANGNIFHVILIILFLTDIGASELLCGHSFYGCSVGKSIRVLRGGGIEK